MHRLVGISALFLLAGSTLAWSTEESDRIYMDGMAKFSQGDVEGGLELIEKSIQVDPSSAHGYEGRAMIRFQQGDAEGAESDFEQAIEIDPESIIGLSGRGSMRYRAGDYQGAIADSDRALSIRPDMVGAYLSRGAAYRALGRYAEAETDLDRVVSEQPGAFRARLERARLYYKTKRFDQAQADLEIARRVKPNDEEVGELATAISSAQGGRPGTDRVEAADPARGACIPYKEFSVNDFYTGMTRAEVEAISGPLTLRETQGSSNAPTIWNTTHDGVQYAFQISEGDCLWQINSRQDLGLIRIDDDFVDNLAPRLVGRYGEPTTIFPSAEEEWRLNWLRYRTGDRSGGPDYKVELWIKGDLFSESSNLQNGLYPTKMDLNVTNNVILEAEKALAYGSKSKEAVDGIKF